jgi:hypothetical protein
MRLGGPTSQKNPDSKSWVAGLKQLGYRAAYCPVDETADTVTVNAFARAASDADIIIAEVGVWNNPLSPNADERKRAIELCQRKLALADAIGARCCVNISGSRGALWDGPHPHNYSTETFEMIVETTRSILDAVRPTRTFYTLEPMPWMLPDSGRNLQRTSTLSTSSPIRACTMTTAAFCVTALNASDRTSKAVTPKISSSPTS